MPSRRDYKIFVSHSSKDRTVAEAIVELLRRALGLRANHIRCTSVDGYALPPGADSDNTLRNDIELCQAFVAILTQSSLASSYVLFEIGARWGSNKPIVPILCAGCPISAIRAPLSGTHAVKCEVRGQVVAMVRTLANSLRLQLEPQETWEVNVTRLLEINTERATEVREETRNYVAAECESANAMVEATCELLLTENKTNQLIRTYLSRLCSVLKRSLHESIAWLDVMVPINIKQARFQPLDDELVRSVKGWLSVEHSEVLRTTPRMGIPVSVGTRGGAKYFRGSATAFASGGMDYLDCPSERIPFGDYPISSACASRLVRKYQEWERSHYFSALLAIAILKGRKSVGVLNLNFRSKYPFGKQDQLPPELQDRIRRVLDCHIKVIGSML